MSSLPLALSLTLSFAAADGRPGEAAHQAGPDAEERPPNILLIVADDLGYESLGSNGGTSYPTPNLDALAAGGQRFVHCYSTPKCVPSRLTLLTGRYAFRMETKTGLDPGAKTFASVLGDAGYATVIAGKWQLKASRRAPAHAHGYGFDETTLWGWREGSRYWNPAIYRDGEELSDTEGRFGPDVFTETLIGFMEAHRDEPFLAYYPMVLPHLRVKGESPGRSGDRRYAELVGQVDRQVGRLVAALERLGLRERTLLVFTADNGSPASVRNRVGDVELRGGKGRLTDAGTHVPLIVSRPGSVAAGVNSDLVDFSDFFPTLLDVARVRSPGELELDGYSFARWLNGAAVDPRTFVYTDWKGSSWTRDRRFKLYDDGRLFDMVADPLEERPIGPEATHSDQARSAREALGRAWEAVRGPREGTSEPPGK